MSIVFDGTSDYLRSNTSVIGSSGDFGYLFATWFKQASISNGWMMSICDNAGGTARDSIALVTAGAEIRCNIYNGSSNDITTTNGYITDTWTPAFLWASASNGRQVKLGDGGWVATGANIPLIGLSWTIFGTLFVNSGPNNVFSWAGQLAESAVWTQLANTTERDEVVDAYLATHCPLICPRSDNLVLYKQFLDATAGANDVGPVFTLLGNTHFDADHPSIIYSLASSPIRRIGKRFSHVGNGRGLVGV